MARFPLRIGTRSSRLAMKQAHLVAEALLATHGDWSPEDVRIVPMVTSGDRMQQWSLATMGGKGLFTKELEQGLCDGTIDMAVHSLKDLPPGMPDGLCLAAVLPRSDPRDALIFRGGSSLDSLPSGATVGTASVRRQWQLYHHRPDLRTVLMRGNVLTRLEKMDGGEVDATFLAVAGLERLGIDPVAYHPLSTSTMLPAVAQGAIGIQTLESDGMVRGYVAAIHDSLTGEAVGAERALMWLLSGSCTTPMAGLATMVGDQWCLEGWLADPETGRQSRQLVSWRVGSGDEAASIESLAENLRRAVFV